MGKNMFYQFTEMLTDNFEENKGGDKHSDKANDPKHDKIYHSAEWNNLMDTAKDFSKFMKAEFSDVKKIQNIQPDHITAFLETKVEGCTQTTIGQYYDRFLKIGRVMDREFGTDTSNWKKDVETPVSEKGSSIRNIAMLGEHRDMIREVIMDKDELCKGDIGIILGMEWGLRVKSTTNIQPRDVDLENMKLTVHLDKGKRTRVLEIRNETQVELLEKAIEGKRPDEELLGIEPDSVNKRLSRIEDDLEIRERYKEAKTGLHSIRKLVAQELYDEYRKTHDKKETKAYINVFLGHGAERSIKSYVFNAW